MLLWGAGCVNCARPVLRGLRSSCSLFYSLAIAHEFGCSWGTLRHLDYEQLNPLFSQVVPIGMTRMVIDENHYEDICRLLADALLSHDTNAV